MTDPLARFEEACEHDRAGREAEAIPCYEEAYDRAVAYYLDHLN